MDPVYHVLSVSNPTSLYVRKPFSVATLSTAHSSNTASPRQHILPASPKSATSRLLHQSFVPVSQFIRASRNLLHVLGRLSQLLVREEVWVVWLASMQRQWVCM